MGRSGRHCRAPSAWSQPAAPLILELQRSVAALRAEVRSVKVELEGSRGHGRTQKVMWADLTAGDDFENGDDGNDVFDLPHDAWLRAEQSGHGKDTERMQVADAVEIGEGLENDVDGNEVFKLSQHACLGAEQSGHSKDTERMKAADAEEVGEGYAGEWCKDGLPAMSDASQAPFVHVEIG